MYEPSGNKSIINFNFFLLFFSLSASSGYMCSRCNFCFIKKKVITKNTSSKHYSTQGSDSRRQQSLHDI